MRVEYETHLFIPGGLLLWVNEWQPIAVRWSLLAMLTGRQRAISTGLPVRRCYAFERESRRWLDDSKHVVLATDPRHMCLIEIMVAQSIEQSVDQLVGL